MVLALCLALGGTGAAARSLVTGKDFANGSLTGADFRDRSLRRSDFAPGMAPRGPRGARGPRGPAGPIGPPGAPVPSPEIPVAYASVDADGTVLAGRGITATRAGEGEYCLAVPGARWVHAASGGEAQAVAAVVYAAGQAPAPCAADATIRVAVAGASGHLADGPFRVLARTG